MDRRLGHIPHHVQGAESRMKPAPIAVFLQRKLNELTNAKTLFWGGGQLIKGRCLLFAGVLEPNLCDNRGITELEYFLFTSTLASYSGSLRHRRGLNILVFTLALPLDCEELQVT